MKFSETNAGLFSGRESRRQFLPKMLFTIGVIIIAAICVSPIVGKLPSAFGKGLVFCTVLSLLIVVVALIPPMVRRMHDLGLSGWWLLLFVIAQNVMRNIRVPIVVIVWAVVELGFYLCLCLWPGTRGPNKYGSPVKTWDFTWIKWMAIVLAVPATLLGAAFAFTAPARNPKLASWYKGLSKGMVVRKVCATPCKKGDYYYCRRCMTNFIWMDVVSYSTDKDQE